MSTEKRLRVIEAVKNMTEHEADVLAGFISGFRAGEQAAEKGRGKELARAT